MWKIYRQSPTIWDSDASVGSLGMVLAGTGEDAAIRKDADELLVMDASYRKSEGKMLVT